MADLKADRLKRPVSSRLLVISSCICMGLWSQGTSLKGTFDIMYILFVSIEQLLLYYHQLS